MTLEKHGNLLLLNALYPNDITKNSLICSTHFQQHDLRMYSKTNVLSETAVSSIFNKSCKKCKLSVDLMQFNL